MNEFNFNSFWSSSPESLILKSSLNQTWLDNMPGDVHPNGHRQGWRGYQQLAWWIFEKMSHQGDEAKTYFKQLGAGFRVVSETIRGREHAEGPRANDERGQEEGALRS